jgi:thioredoxin reductase (NADPH)
MPDLALENGFIKVDREMRTNVQGVFAAGDCTGKPWQIAKAVGEGLVAALSAVDYLATLA